MLRVILASLLGGTLMFMAGAVSHMSLKLESRAMVAVPDEAAMKSFVSQQQLSPGIYNFPAMRADLGSLTAEEQAAEMERISKLYKEGPSGILIMAPTGEEPMSSKQLVGEFVADVGAAFVGCLLLSCLNPSIPFLGRWLLLVFLAPASWLSLSFSYWLWYRFPLPFVLDGLYCALIEWALAGLLIAAMVRPKQASAA